MESRSFVACATCALALGVGVYAASFATGELRAQDDEAVEIGDIYVVGTRRPVRSTADTPAPIDLIAGDDFTDQGTTNLPDLMRTLVPSYNIATQPISDAATFIRPANLRGLGPDQTLVFVNGKRRHRAAVISWLGNGLSEGAQGPDISVIPAIALKRVEVLRDTASAQYGSDAIAGVMNFVLKDRPEGGMVETQWGRTYEGDGDAYRIAANAGLPLGDAGFANLSAQWHESQPTVRSVQRADAEGLIEGGNTYVREPYAQIWGQPDVSGDYTLFLNTGVEMNEAAEVYAFGNFANRETEGGFFFRNPNTRGGVFANRLVGDLRPNDGMACPAITPTDDFFSPEAARAYMNANPGCFVFNERFPGGFTPQFKGEVSDTAGTAGLRGAFDSGLTYDVSYTMGVNEIDFSMRDTINASLGPDTPTQFELGSYTQTEQTANFDLTYEMDVAAFDSPLHTAVGVEWRREQFEIAAGEPASWRAGPLASDGFGIGANGFSGFSDVVAGSWSRSNVAGYVDLEADVTEKVTVGTMGRVEHFDDFDTTTDAKLGGLYQVTDNFGLRGSASTGFRAPTVGQQNVINVTTAFFTDAVTGRTGLTQRGTIPPTCAEARLKGGKPLAPEESLTFTVGMVAESGPFSFTADYYRIDVEGRLAQSATKNLTDEEKAAIGDDGCIPAGDIGNFRYFTNSLDTRTQGVDLVASLDLSSVAAGLEDGQTELVFVGNWTQTKVTKHDPEALDRQRIVQLEDALPKVRFNTTLRHEQERWGAFARVNYFGSYSEYHADVGSWLFHPGAEFTVDVEASYKPISGLELSLGAENVLNNFPDENPFARNVGSKYPESAPMGFAGGFYYARARYSF